jgi:tetratricopeptide (TPR) repeat protein
MSYFYAVSGRWGSRINRFEALLKVGRGQLTPEREAWILINELSYMYISREEWDLASTAIIKGLRLLEGRWAGASVPKVEGKSLIRDEANVNFMRVIALRYLGLVTAGKNDPERGVEHLRNAIGKFLQMRRRTIAANTSIELGETYLLAGNPELSRQAFEEGLKYHLAQADTKPWVNSWIARGELGLGNIEFRKGELDAARSHYEEAASRSMIVDNVDALAMATRGRAVIAEAMGDTDLALNLANAARAGFVRVGKGEAVQMMSDLIARCGG